MFKKEGIVSKQLIVVEVGLEDGQILHLNLLRGLDGTSFGQQVRKAIGEYLKNQLTVNSRFRELVGGSEK